MDGIDIDIDDYLLRTIFIDIVRYFHALLATTRCKLWNSLFSIFHCELMS